MWWNTCKHFHFQTIYIQTTNKSVFLSDELTKKYKVTTYTQEMEDGSIISTMAHELIETVSRQCRFLSQSLMLPSSKRSAFTLHLFWKHLSHLLSFLSIFLLFFFLYIYRLTSSFSPQNSKRIKDGRKERTSRLGGWQVKPSGSLRIKYTFLFYIFPQFRLFFYFSYSLIRLRVFFSFGR